jgi:hypothetical protein
LTTFPRWPVFRTRNFQAFKTAISLISIVKRLGPSSRGANANDWTGWVMPSLWKRGLTS